MHAVDNLFILSVFTEFTEFQIFGFKKKVFFIYYVSIIMHLFIFCVISLYLKEVSIKTYTKQLLLTID